VLAGWYQRECEERGERPVEGWNVVARFAPKTLDDADEVQDGDSRVASGLVDLYTMLENGTPTERKNAYKIISTEFVEEILETFQYQTEGMRFCQVDRPAIRAYYIRLLSPRS
jgi:hypothetical protein